MVDSITSTVDGVDIDHDRKCQAFPMCKVAELQSCRVDILTM